MSPPLRVIVVGARSARQGIGEFVAGWFARHGANVTAIVGTRDATVEAARGALRERYGIDCRGYTDLAQALAAEPGDAVAVCSPYRHHADQLRLVGDAHRHCLCEKPLCWPTPEGGLPLAPFVAGGKHLAVLTQWPCTLSTFYALFPAQANAVPTTFEMRLSPLSSGLDMVPDAVPHFLSMIRAILGPTGPSRQRWQARRVTGDFLGGDPRRLRIVADITHHLGSIRATLHLETCPQRPRPAWYAINGARVEREVEMATYQQYFRAEDRRIPLPDPLGQHVSRFLKSASAGVPTDRAALDHDQELLTLFHSAVRAGHSEVES